MIIVGNFHYIGATIWTCIKMKIYPELFEDE